MTKDEVMAEGWFGGQREKVLALIAERDALRAELSTNLADYRATRFDLAAAQAEVEQLKGICPELPPIPPDGAGLPRYGLRWNGPQAPLTVPMPDGYWTPWHLADQARADLAAARELLDLWMQDENWQRNSGRRLNFPTDIYVKTERWLYPDLGQSVSAPQIEERTKVLTEALASISLSGNDNTAPAHVVLAGMARRAHAALEAWKEANRG